MIGWIAAGVAAVVGTVAFIRSRQPRGIPMPRPMTAEQLTIRALQLEQEGRYDEAHELHIRAAAMQQ